MPKRQSIKYSKWEIALYWNQSSERARFAPRLLDLDEPRCFACGWYSESWYKPVSPEKRWQRATLERAHIIPDSLGGSGELENIILLCKECHGSSPDWAEPSAMAEWLMTREERPSEDWATFYAWLAAAQEVPEFQQFCEVAVARGTEDVDKRRLTEAVEQAFTQASIHFGKMSQGTRVAIIKTAVAAVSEEAK